MHVSTAFSNCDHDHIDEKFYPPKYNPDKLIRLTETVDEPYLSQLTPLYVYLLYFMQHVIIMEVLCKFNNFYLIFMFKSSLLQNLRHELPEIVIFAMFCVLTFN